MARPGALLAAMVMVLCAGGARADQTHGKIQTLDATRNEVVLDSGTRFKLGGDASARNLKEGDDVVIVFEERGGEKIVSSIRPRTGDDSLKSNQGQPEGSKPATAR